MSNALRVYSSLAGRWGSLKKLPLRAQSAKGATALLLACSSVAPCRTDKQARVSGGLSAGGHAADARLLAIPPPARPWPGDPALIAASLPHAAILAQDSRLGRSPPPGSVLLDPSCTSVHRPSTHSEH